MSPDPLSPDSPANSPQPEPSPYSNPTPDYPAPQPPDLYPPTSPGAPLIDPPPIAPVTMQDGTAYPAAPPSYETSPLAPPYPTEGVDIRHSTYQEPTYRPENLSHGDHAVPSPREQAQPATDAYPDAPPTYERRASDKAGGAQQPATNFGRRHTDRAPGSPATGGSPGTPSRAPAALLTILILAVVALIGGGAWYFLHAGGHVITAGGELAATAAGLHYENPHEHIAFTAPGTWTRFPAATAQVMVRGDGCSFGLLEQRTLLSAHQLADAEAQDLHHRHPEADPVISSRTIAGHDALTFSGTYTDSEGQPMTQTYILVDRGANLLTLIETGTASACPSSFSSLEDSLHI